MNNQEHKTETEKQQSCGNAGAVESLENQPQVFHPSHRPWKSLRDSHIPTAPATNPIYLCKPNPDGRGASPLAYELKSSCR
jgi:hypothetical protein